MGPQIGKIGPVVGRRWKNRNVFSGYNPFPKDPKSDAQKIVRVRFATINKLAARMACAINLGYGHKADSENTTTRGLFVKDNFQWIQATTVDSVSVGYADLVVANGSHPGVQFGAPNFDNPQTVSVGFATNEEIPGAALTDKVYLLVYCPDAQCAVIGQTTRGAQNHSVSVTVPAYWNGMKVHLYGFTMCGATEPTYISELGGYVYPRMVSMSDYVGTGNIG